MALSYAAAGVDLAKAKLARSKLISKLDFVRSGLGAPLLRFHFAGVIDIGGPWCIAVTNDGVGTKLIIADLMRKWDTVGIDCIAMNVNDLLAIGAEPVALVDYIAMQSYDESKAEQIAIGLNKGAQLANITILGGETAALPGIITGFDLAGTGIGIVPRDRIITGREIKPGDLVIGLESSGIHSNGLSLARKIIESSSRSYWEWFGDRLLGEELLEPSLIYTGILPLFRECQIHGLVHITGGGFTKLARVTDYGFLIDDPLEPQPIFQFLRELGGISWEEMYSTFNMGMGFCLVLDRDQAEQALKLLGGKYRPKIVGKILESPGIRIRAPGIEIKLQGS